VADRGLVVRHALQHFRLEEPCPGVDEIARLFALRRLLDEAPDAQVLIYLDNAVVPRVVDACEREAECRPAAPVPFEHRVEIDVREDIAIADDDGALRSRRARRFLHGASRTK